MNTSCHLCYFYVIYVNYITRACQETPSQYIKNEIDEKRRNSRVVKSVGICVESDFEKPNITFIQDLKKNVGPIKYKKTSKNKAKNGNKSKRKLKNRNSETNIIEPGNPKNIKVFNKVIRKSLGHIKFNPLTSVSKRVLNLLATASTSKNELVDNNAWLIIIQKLASIKFDCPLTTQIVSQCISTTVEYATNFLRSI